MEKKIVRDELGMATNDFENMDLANMGGLKAEINSFVASRVEVGTMATLDEFVLRGYWAEAVKSAVLDLVARDGYIQRFSYEDDMNLLVSFSAPSHILSYHFRKLDEAGAAANERLKNIKL